ncbi:hypothetical protein [Pollutimonas bauzanensis]|uniref:Uncharacterized protein n=1 Tax=Pollutimonas bauzanensis TaxID=658167 RepID=A0A1M5ZMA0_9BURK|nr:hypothetical protein [Pollutimonas bauzanensis]SHI25296.1 hypothetical protein SAMN04488135_11618 [Pollutimonas bauzanensis]
MSSRRHVAGLSLAALFCRPLACIAFCLFIAMGQGMAHGIQNEGADLITNFDIPAQGLESALAQYGAVTGLSVLVASRVTAGLRSMAVRYSSPTAFTLVPPAPSRKPAPMAGKRRYRAVLQLWIGVQGRIERVRIVEPSGSGERDRALLRHLTDVIPGPVFAG